MPITAQNQHRAELAKQTVDKSQLNADAKADFDELLQQSLENTNGLKPEEKLDAIADTLFQLTRLVVIHIAERPAIASWRDVVVACRREIAAVALALLTVLALRPQLGALIEHFLP